jgi:hypothetical protein
VFLASLSSFEERGGALTSTEGTYLPRRFLDA